MTGETHQLRTWKAEKCWKSMTSMTKKTDEIWRNMDDFPIPRDCSSDMFEDVCLIPWHAREGASRCWSLPTQDSWIEVWIWQTVGKPARMGPRNRSNILKHLKAEFFEGCFFDGWKLLQNHESLKPNCAPISATKLLFIQMSKYTKSYNMSNASRYLQ